MGKAVELRAMTRCFSRAGVRAIASATPDALRRRSPKVGAHLRLVKLAWAPRSRKFRNTVNEAPSCCQTWALNQALATLLVEKTPDF
eukprot:5695466-Alexandrium_andersonii.AAC.1